MAGTTVNWSACLPPRVETLDAWRSRFGLSFTRQNLQRFLIEVVNFLHINNNDRYNTSAEALKRGCTALGYDWRNLPNNTHNCRECGSCGVGCPYDRKQSGIVTWLPAAVSKGATIYTDVKVNKLVRNGRPVPEVEASFLDAQAQSNGRQLTVKPKLGILLAAGAIGTPAILLRSNLNPNKLVGRFTHLHPVTICIGGGLRGFSHLSIPDRQRVLERLSKSNVQQFRNLYAAGVNISASAYYSSEATWSSIQYDGVSVDHPEILTNPQPPWRPHDPRPIEP